MVLLTLIPIFNVFPSRRARLTPLLSAMGTTLSLMCRIFRGKIYFPDSRCTRIITAMLKSSRVRWVSTAAVRIQHGHASSSCPQAVMIVGASNSGEDISREVAKLAARVFVCARNFKSEPLATASSGPHERYGSAWHVGLCLELQDSPPQFRHPVPSELTAEGNAVFDDGTSIGPIDSIIYCTGFRYTFPFLHLAAAGSVDVSDQRVGSVSLLPPQLPFYSPTRLDCPPQAFVEASVSSRPRTKLVSDRAAMESGAFSPASNAGKAGGQGAVGQGRAARAGGNDV